MEHYDLPKYYSSEQIGKNMLGGSCGVYGRDERCIQSFGVEIWLKLRPEDNIEIVLFKEKDLQDVALHLCDSGLGHLAGFCELSNEPSGSNKLWKIVSFSRKTVFHLVKSS
jgi:hypothetical protein